MKEKTDQGTSGWVAWGTTADGSPESKVGFEHAIRATPISGQATAYGDAPHTLSWTDGVPARSASNVANGIFVEGVGNGFNLNLPASLQQRTTVKIYVGVFLGKGKFHMVMNDGETVYGDDSLDAITSMTSGVYTITYETTDKWPVEATWTLAESYGLGEERGGAGTKATPFVAIQAVTLSTIDVSAPGVVTPPAGDSGAATQHVPIRPPGRPEGGGVEIERDVKEVEKAVKAPGTGWLIFGGVAVLVGFSPLFLRFSIENAENAPFPVHLNNE